MPEKQQNVYKNAKIDTYAYTHAHTPASSSLSIKSMHMPVMPGKDKSNTRTSTNDNPNTNSTSISTSASTSKAPSSSRFSPRRSKRISIKPRSSQPSKSNFPSTSQSDASSQFESKSKSKFKSRFSSRLSFPSNAAAHGQVQTTSVHSKGEKGDSGNSNSGRNRYKQNLNNSTHSNGASSNGRRFVRRRDVNSKSKRMSDIDSNANNCGSNSNHSSSVVSLSASVSGPAHTHEEYKTIQHNSSNNDENELFHSSSSFSTDQQSIHSLPSTLQASPMSSTPKVIRRGRRGRRNIATATPATTNANMDHSVRSLPSTLPLTSSTTTRTEASVIDERPIPTRHVNTSNKGASPTLASTGSTATSKNLTLSSKPSPRSRQRSMTALLLASPSGRQKIKKQYKQENVTLSSEHFGNDLAREEGSSSLTFHSIDPAPNDTIATLTAATATAIGSSSDQISAQQRRRHISRTSLHSIADAAAQVQQMAKQSTLSISEHNKKDNNNNNVNNNLQHLNAQRMMGRNVIDDSGTKKANEDTDPMKRNSMAVVGMDDKMEERKDLEVKKDISKKDDKEKSDGDLNDILRNSQETKNTGTSHLRKKKKNHRISLSEHLQQSIRKLMSPRSVGTPRPSKNHHNQPKRHDLPLSQDADNTDKNNTSVAKGGEESSRSRTIGHNDNTVIDDRPIPYQNNTVTRSIDKFSSFSQAIVQSPVIATKKLEARDSPQFNNADDDNTSSDDSFVNNPRMIVEKQLRPSSRDGKNLAVNTGNKSKNSSKSKAIAATTFPSPRKRSSTLLQQRSQSNPRPDRRKDREKSLPRLEHIDKSITSSHDRSRKSSSSPRSGRRNVISEQSKEEREKVENDKRHESKQLPESQSRSSTAGSNRKNIRQSRHIASLSPSVFGRRSAFVNTSPSSTRMTMMGIAPPLTTAISPSKKGSTIKMVPKVRNDASPGMSFVSPTTVKRSSDVDASKSVPTTARARLSMDIAPRAPKRQVRLPTTLPLSQV